MSRATTRLGFVEPQLLTPTDQPPQRSGWIHEVKHDGYRTLLVIERGNVCYTRNGFDWNERYPGIISAAGELRCRAAILDGEVIVQDERGVSDFEALSAAIRWLPHTLRFYAFDILHLNGEDLRDQPLLDRRTKLKGLLGRDRTSPLQFSDEFTGDSAAFFRACTKHGLEGVVSKLASSRYRSGRSKTWLKSKCFTESDLVIIGTDRDRKTGATRALLANADLTYAGAAFIGLRGDAWHDLHERLRQISIKRAPLSGLRMKGAQWVEPRLTAKVRHLLEQNISAMPC
jgi:DNA ligase D-like protein (predicted ligase)